MLPDLLHRLELSVVHMYSCLYLFQRSLQYKYIWNQSVLSIVPWLLQAQLLSAECGLGNETINII